MGWLWSSGSGSGSQLKGNPQDTDSSSTTENPSTSSKALEPTSYSDDEITKFLRELHTELNSNNSDSNKPSPPSKPTTTETPPEPSSSSSSPQEQPPALLDPLTESLLPTTMSCRQAFDQAYYCNSLGGQWMSVYRAGTMRACSEHWNDFWFCMRTRAYSGAVKEEAIRAHYRAKERSKYGPGMPNSTDVWEPRSEKLPADQIFPNPRYVKPDIDDEEWRRLEIERRRWYRLMIKEQEEREEAARRAAGEETTSI